MVVSIVTSRLLRVIQSLHGRSNPVVVTHPRRRELLTLAQGKLRKTILFTRRRTGGEFAGYFAGRNAEGGEAKSWARILAGTTRR